MSQQTLLFANFLAPALNPTYQSLVEHVGRRVGMPTCLVNGESPDDFADGVIDAGFLCGLAYTHLACSHPALVEPVAAPILKGIRYQQRPWYFSDIVVRDESDIRTLEDIRGRRWAYNERSSHSGYTLVQHTLLERGERLETFASVQETGSHAQSLRMVIEGRADAAALDSHMLAVVLHDHPDIARAVRIIASFGPSTMPPVVVASRLAGSVKCAIQEAFLTLHLEPVPALAQALEHGFIDHFTPIRDEHYHDIRAIYAHVQRVKYSKTHQLQQKTCTDADREIAFSPD